MLRIYLSLHLRNISMYKYLFSTLVEHTKSTWKSLKMFRFAFGVSSKKTWTSDKQLLLLHRLNKLCLIARKVWGYISQIWQILWQSYLMPRPICTIWIARPKLRDGDCFPPLWDIGICTMHVHLIVGIELEHISKSWSFGLLVSFYLSKLEFFS